MTAHSCECHLLDTDVLIDFLRGHEPAVSFVENNADRIILSSIVVAELYAGVRGGEKDRERTVLENFLSLFRVVPVSRDIAKLGGLYKRDYCRSHGVGIADAILAATATLADAEMKTLNVRHYPMLGNLEPAYRKNRN